MKTVLKTFFKYLFLFLVGGAIYVIIELVCRGRSHWTMAVVGGICFVLCGILNEIFTWKSTIWFQMLICSLIITAVEFISGLILNIHYGLAIWDYSNIPFNILGQICLPFTVLWFFISAPAIVLDDYLRYWFFGEEKPHYIIKIGGKPNADHRSRIS